jgi:hypothetical protein
MLMKIAELVEKLMEIQAGEGNLEVEFYEPTPYRGNWQAGGNWYGIAGSDIDIVDIDEENKRVVRIG